MGLNRIRLPSIINGFIEAITSLCHVFRDWLQDPLNAWSVLTGWNRFESYLIGFEVRAYFQAWLLYSSACLRLGLYTAVLVSGKNLPVTTVQTRTNYICSTPELSENNFCDDVEMKLTSLLGGIQHEGAPEIATKSGTPCFYLRLVIISGYIQVCMS